MTSPFAAATNRLNNAVLVRLSSDVVAIGGDIVPALFENGFAFGNVGLIGMASSQPSITLKTSDVPSNPVGTAVTVNATSYLVAAHEPDGTGMSRLMLEVA